VHNQRPPQSQWLLCEKGFVTEPSARLGEEMQDTGCPLVLGANLVAAGKTNSTDLGPRKRFLSEQPSFHKGVFVTTIVIKP
jgi:hypothetical protein